MNFQAAVSESQWLFPAFTLRLSEPRQDACPFPLAGVRCGAGSNVWVNKLDRVCFVAPDLLPFTGQPQNRVQTRRYIPVNHLSDLVAPYCKRRAHNKECDGDSPCAGKSGIAAGTVCYAAATISFCNNLRQKNEKKQYNSAVVYPMTPRVRAWKWQ